MRIRERVTTVLAMALLAAFGPGAGGRQQAADGVVWIEAEGFVSSDLPAASENGAMKVAGWGHPEFLSGGKWMQVSVDADKVASTVPADGFTMSYRINLPSAGRRELWNRIGYEFVRSPFSWRVDNGAWATVSPDALTTDLMELADWNEVAWLKLGDADLSAGAHTLQIRLPRTAEKDGKPARLLYASDAIVVSDVPFSPNGRFKPGEGFRDARDDAAAAKSFAVPAVASGARSTVPLAGDWEICRADESLPPFDIATPISLSDVPEDAHWKAISVPSDKNESRPDLLMAHRVWYRTRVSIPENMAGRAAFLTFPRNNLNTTVYVNGVLCGFQKNPNVKFDLDISKGLKVGANEILVGIRDPWYAYSGNPKDPMKRRRKFNLPVGVTKSGFQDLSYPVWNAWESGIVQTPSLTVTGGAREHLADVFVKPAVDVRASAKNRLDVDVTIHNPDALPNGVGVGFEVFDARTGESVKGIEAGAWAIFEKGEATKTVTLSAAWPAGKPWWPEPGAPLYRLRTRLWHDFGSGKPAPRPQDERFDRFGFRTWGSRGKDFTLNGMVWHGWADLGAGESPAAFLANYRKTGQRFLRLSGYAQGGPAWHGLLPGAALDFFDENGVVVRRSGDLDGEAIGYMAIENDPDLRALHNNSQVKYELIRNWQDQMVAQVKAERNHPSVHLWSIENEFLYINCINLYGNLMDEFEAAVLTVGDAVAKADPTRLWMTDGGGAGKANAFPVHGDHYIFDENNTRFPDIAYEPNPTGGGRGRWVWDQMRPRYAGEDYFATGINPADYAAIGGEAAFAGKAETRPAAGKIERILTEGYRWAGFGAFHFWLGSESAIDQYGANAEIAAFVREQNSTFGAGQNVTRTVRVFNDSFHEEGPLTLACTVTVGGKPVGKGTQTLTVPRGENRETTLALTLPAVTARTLGSLALTVTASGKIVFADTKSLAILPRPEPLATARAGVRSVANSPSNAPALAGIYVYDPSGETRAALIRHGLTFGNLASLDALPVGQAGRSLVIVGRDALTLAESTSPRLASFAASGGRVVVLEQKNPLKFQGLPAPIESTGSSGRIAFLEDATHPALAGLADSDFFTWGPDRPIYRSAYTKPERGARSLIQCDQRLGKSALIEAPVGPGLLLLCQLTIAENVARSAPAETLLVNLVRYARGYRQVVRPVYASLSGGSPELGKALDSMGLKYTTVAEPLAALRPGAVAIVAATPANLKTLAANKAKVDTFTRAGGYLVLCGLTPDGLADYDTLVGVDHLIRPFRREKVGLALPRPPLAAGLSAGDAAQLSGKRIFGWTADEFVADDLFTYVVDAGSDIARFGKIPDAAYFGNSDSTNDHNPQNVYDGMTATDGWVFTFSQWAGSGAPKPIPFTFDKPRTFTEITWQGTNVYYRTTKIALTFDGKDRIELPVSPGNSPQTLAINPPRTASKVELQIVGWNPVQEPAIVGIEEVGLKAARPTNFSQTVRPLTDVGGLVSYPKGAGGIVLCNLNFKANEAVPINGVKKRSLLAGVLRNLKAPFAGGAAVVAGATGLRYDTIEIGSKATIFRNERGWFGDPKRTLAGLPTGRQTFAGVPFIIYEFPTSPVPTAIALGGPGVPNNPPDSVRGIVVNRKADALFFLQTARVDRRRDDRERREKRPIEFARYVITYADGQKINVPIRLEDDVDDFRQRSPAGLPGAALAWSRPFDTGDPESAAAWIMPWTNPRPDTAIAAIDLEYAGERRAIPVLLAVHRSLGGVDLHPPAPSSGCSVKSS